ncbi:LiaF transmembrane domain-containing protein [Clostridium sp. Marseille-P299]|uniref:LiaF transmembrane domain-containing protein n=1 Tax=Clostridium sp. Marseille-P299 TaxID=1805477 RepID=UPI0008327ACB|nr:LiaF domain-containing protein [Clostridium sp. Marseille-P299]
MKRNSNGFIWGIILIVLGLFIASRAFGLITFSIFFDGWWTLFIIIPCFIGLFSNEHGKMSYLVGLCIGVLLLMSAQHIITWRMFGPLIFAVILVLAGISILFKKDPSEYQNHYTEHQNGHNFNQSGEYKEYKSNHDANGDSTNASFEYTYSNDENNTTSENNTQNRNYNTGNNNKSYQNYHTGAGYCACTAVFSGKDIRFDNKEFRGAALSTIFGGIELDLRNAIINENVVIDAKAILGGIDIFVPNYVRVSIDCTPILGGVDDKTRTPLGANESTPTIFINATCVLGGIDVK